MSKSVDYINFVAGAVVQFMKDQAFSLVRVRHLLIDRKHRVMIFTRQILEDRQSLSTALRVVKGNELLKG